MIDPQILKKEEPDIRTFTVPPTEASLIHADTT